MARRKKASYVPDPKRRAYLASVRTIRSQVEREYADELAEAGVFRRMLLLFRINREIRKRLKDIEAPPVQPKKRPPLK